MTEINPSKHPTLIGIDDEVLAEITRMAQPFVDDPNAVLRRVLGLEGGSPTKRTAASAASRRKQAARHAPSTNGSTPPRAPKGSLTPEEEFEIPILATLEEAGGSLPYRQAVSAVGQRMESKLNEHDRFEDDKGVSRWQKRVPFVRLRLVQRGLLDSDAPRGTWQLTDEGRSFLAQHTGE